MTNTRFNVLSSTSSGVLGRIGYTFIDALSDPSVLLVTSTMGMAISFGYSSRGDRVSVSVFRGMLGAVAATFVWSLHPSTAQTAGLLLFSSWVGATLGEAVYQGENKGAGKGGARKGGEEGVQRKSASAPLHPNAGISEEVNI